jgi:uncharacterized DUF497 family protein
LEFEWDEAKSRENLRKHDVRFETARLVFDDPFAVTVRADSDEADEERWVTVGSSGGRSLFFVVHTWRDEETVRLISARNATAKERKTYEEAHEGTEKRHRGVSRQKGRRH